MSPHTHGQGRCRDLAVQISEYLDGEMSPARAARLERHLAGCVCCTGFAASLRRAILACRASGQTILPATLRRRARHRIAELLGRRPQRPARKRAPGTKHTENTKGTKA